MRGFVAIEALGDRFTVTTFEHADECGPGEGVTVFIHPSYAYCEVIRDAFVQVGFYEIQGHAEPEPEYCNNCYGRTARGGTPFTCPQCKGRLQGNKPAVARPTFPAIEYHLGGEG